MVGINTAVAGVGLGLAVPVNATTRRIVSALMRDGRVRRAYLGVVVAPAPVAPVWRPQLGGRATGLRVASVVSGGPADRAGLRTGDLLLTAGGHEVATAQDLQRLMFAEAIGRPLPITVMRNGALVDVIAEPAELVRDLDASPAAPRRTDSPQPLPAMRRAVMPRRRQDRKSLSTAGGQIGRDIHRRRIAAAGRPAARAQWKRRRAAEPPDAGRTDKWSKEAGE